MIENEKYIEDLVERIKARNGTHEELCACDPTGTLKVPALRKIVQGKVKDPRSKTVRAIENALKNDERRTRR